MGEAFGCLIVIGLTIYLLTIMTDQFFIVSLDQLSQRWRLPSSVAGASLMAMGSSAPELAIAFMTLLKDEGAHSDVGMGTIVGSALFNLLVITGVSAIAQPVRVRWQVVVRDVTMYTASVVLLLITFADGAITLMEAVAFIGLYGLYLFILFCQRAESGIQVEGEVDSTAQAVSSRSVSHWHAVLTQSLGVLMGDARQSYQRAFWVSILLITAISWVLVEAAVRFAEAVGLPPVIIALTILAGGTSVPDMIASLVVARQGRGEMAIANAIGSNTFDILVGLGLPWLIVVAAHGSPIQIATEQLWQSTLVLLGTVILLFIFLTTERLLSRKEGWMLLGAYGLYVIWTWLGN
jgi:K+-dependent Na+/Ca+ exchanger-like protein